MNMAKSPRETLIYSSFPRRGESRFLIFLDSSLRWNDKNGMIQSFLR
jgi:hypothetical protein